MTTYIPELATREKPSGPVLSDYLEGLVCRGLVPRAIAEEINPYSDETVQRALVNYFWAQQRVEASKVQWRRRTLIRIGSITTGGALATLCFTWAVIYVQTPRPIHRTTIPTPVVIPKFETKPLVTPRVAPPVTPRPSPHPLQTPHVPRPSKTKILPAAPFVHSALPLNFVVHSNADNILFTWQSMGPDFTYTLYSGEGPTLLNVRKVMDHISSNTYRLSKRNIQDTGSWWAVSATNQYGGETPNV